MSCERSGEMEPNNVVHRIYGIVIFILASVIGFLVYR